MNYKFNVLEEIGNGFFVSRSVIGGRFSANFDTLHEAREAAAVMNANEPEYLAELIEREIAKFTDFAGSINQGILAKRIAGVVTAAFTGTI